jgi:hypothetical protein
MAAEIAIKTGANVVEFVENGNQFLVECLLEVAGQTKGQQIKHLHSIDEKSLNLIIHGSMSAGERTITEAQWRHTCLQAIATPVSCGRESDQYLGHLNMAERIAS